MKVPTSVAEGSGRRIPCTGCGARVPDIDGPTHRYIGASPGCWAMFGEVLAREYSDTRYFAVHRSTVDTYAVQHPGRPSRQSIQSVAVHLVALCVVLERGYEAARATEAIRRALARRAMFTWLEPPASPGAVTILDVHSEQDAAAHCCRVQLWARSVWEAHHETVRRWATVPAP